MKAIFLALMDHHVAATLILLIIIGLRFVLEKLPVRIRVYLWLIPIFILLCPVRIKSDFGLIELPNNTVSYPITRLESINQENIILAGRVDTLTDWIEIFAHVWIAGVGLMFFLSVVHWLYIHFQTRDKVALQSGIYISDYASSAFVTGIFSEKIILPSCLDEVGKHYVTLHEKSHLQMKDHLIRLIGWLCVCIYWFNPVVWFFYRMLILDMEIACDERVLVKLNEDERLNYSQCLLNQSKKMNKRFLVTGFRSSDLKKRIQSAVSFKKNKMIINLLAIVIVIMSGILLISRPNEIEKNSALLKEEMLNQSSQELFSNDVIPFDWDEFIVFRPDYIFSISEIEEALGISDTFQKGKDYGYGLMVFMKNEKPIAWLTLHPDLDEFVFSFSFGSEEILRFTSNELVKLSKTEEYGTIVWRMSGIAYTLESLDEKEHGLVLMFDEILQKAFEMDPGLNHDIEYLVLDLEDLNVLSDKGKSVLMGMIQKDTGIETISRTEADGREEVLLSTYKFENGVILYMRSSEETEDQFSFSYGKWRSATGAIFNRGSTAVYQNGTWTYEEGRWAIS
ncbi:MAG: M56 family metallopeptidase [Erysipelotrichaceae bacterium]|nr:M56 family metallopeptidase [Erysipelotrichaceae bacterium]